MLIETHHKITDKNEHLRTDKKEVAVTHLKKPKSEYDAIAVAWVFELDKMKLTSINLC